LGGFEIVPRQGDDLALLQPANRRNLQLGLTLFPESFEKHFFTTKDCFLQNNKMAAFSRGLRSLIVRSPRREPICSRCLFSTTTRVQSGHSRWSKIKHDKGKADMSKGSQRTILSKDIALASKSMYMSLRCLAHGTDSNCSVRARSKFKSKTSIVAGNGEERYIMGYNTFEIHI